MHLQPSSHSSLPLQHLEQSLEELDLTSFGLMDTTLEEVFLKVSEEDQSLENSDVGMGGSGAQGAVGAAEVLCVCAGLVASLPLHVAAGVSFPKAGMISTELKLPPKIKTPDWLRRFGSNMKLHLQQTQQ